MKKKLLSMFFVLVFLPSLISQVCNIPASPTSFCEATPIICPLDGYCSTNDNSIGPVNVPSTFCGDVNNPNWIGFVAETTVLDVLLHVENCTGTQSGTGLQALVFEGCNGNWATVSNCVYQAVPNEATALNMFNLVIGETYLIMIDGFSGDVCDFSFEVVNGATASSNGIFLSDAGPDQSLTCTNSEVILDGSNSTFDSNATIEWRDIAGNVLGTDTTLTVDQSGTYYLVHIDTLNGCNSFDIVEVGLGGLYTFNLPVEMPLSCNGPMEISGGNFNVPAGPQYSYLWTTNNGNIVSGANSIAPIIDNAGVYFLEITEGNAQCTETDSITIYNFEDGFVDNATQNWNCNNANNGSLTINPVISSVGASNLSFVWTTFNGQITFGVNSFSPIVGSPGTYHYSVSDGTGCNATGSVVVVDNANSPIINIATPDVISCVNTSIVLDASGSSPGNQLSYQWNLNGVAVGNNATITITQAGSYQLLVTDVSNGCNAVESVVVLEDVDVPSFTLSASSVELNCTNNFTETISASGPTGVNFSFEWIGPNGSVGTGTDVVLSGNHEGIFTVVLTNLDNGCTTVQSFQVINNGFQMDVSATAAGCDMADGTAMVTTGLTNPGYAWSTGATTSSVSNLTQGWYSVTLTDLDNNCGKHENFYVDEDISCKVVIGGYVVNDPDMTCTYDSSLEGIECVMVKLEPLGIYTLTDPTGYYEFVVDDGSYTVEFIGSDFVDLQCPTSGSYDVVLDVDGSVSDGNHFFVIRKDIDLCISKFTGNARPGFSQFNCVQICNYGVEASNASVSFVHDSIFSEVLPLPNIDPINSNAVNYMYDASTNTFSWELIDLQPGECRKIMWYMEVPVTTQIGEIITADAKVTPIDNDENPENNCLSWIQTVTGSYDPNDKRNMVGETQWGGEIYEDDITMEYALRFQNVGTDTAFTVVIRDTLDDAHLNVESIRAFTASHPMQVEFEDRNVLIFRFENILLPDSTTNEPASNGWVSFKIDRFDNLPFGTDVTNQASIYFDFNSPVVTNEVVNTLTDVVGIFSPTKDQIQVDVIPNITNDLLTVNLVLEKTSSLGIQLFNAKGIAVQEINFGKKQNGEHRFEMSLKDLPAGVYFILIKTEEGSAVKRVVKI